MCSLYETVKYCLEQVTQKLAVSTKETTRNALSPTSTKFSGLCSSLVDYLQVNTDLISSDSVFDSKLTGEADNFSEAAMKNIFTDCGMSELSPWVLWLLDDIIKELPCGEIESGTSRSHTFLHAIWESLHTGHWSEVPEGYRTAFSYGSIILVGFMLRKLILLLESSSESEEKAKEMVMKVIQACDRGLLMGRPLKNSPLHKVASTLQKFLTNEFDFSPLLNIPQPLLPPLNRVPEEASPFEGLTPLPSLHLPPLSIFLITHMKGRLPVKLLGLADSWPALKKWDLNYLRKVAGARTVPVEVGLRYTDSDWSQKLTTINEYIESFAGKNVSNLQDKKNKVYLAQHQLLDQVPEFLEDIIVPDYCHMGDQDPTINIWVGPQGTVSPLHNDPDHNIFVQVYGFKDILIFPEDASESLYAFEDSMLSNTSMVNLEEETKMADLFERRPLLKGLMGYHVTLGSGEALYLPPKWWHYVKSLSNSISISFWWR